VDKNEMSFHTDAPVYGFGEGEPQFDRRGTNYQMINGRHGFPGLLLTHTNLYPRRRIVNELCAYAGLSRLRLLALPNSETKVDGPVPASEQPLKCDQIDLAFIALFR
jgi:hypothetical protein